MGLVVVTVASGGWPVVEGTGGYPVAESPNGIGFPVTKVAGKFGMPVTYVVGAVPGVASQTLEFGRLTLAGAGGIAPTATGGSISGASITSGTNANHWTMASNGVITPSATGVSAGLAASPYVLTCAFTVGATSGITATITINTLANTYSLSNDSDVTAFLAIATATTAGKTACCRTGNYANPNISKAWGSTTTFTKHTGASPIFDSFDIAGATNLTVDGLEIYRDAVSPAITLVLIYSAATNITIRNCRIHAHHVNPLVFYVTQQMFINGIGFTGTPPGVLTIEDCEIYDVYRGVLLRATTSITIQRCYVHQTHTDSMLFDTTPGAAFYTLTLLDNDIWHICNTQGDHGDAVQFLPGAALSGDWPVNIRRNRILVTNPLGEDPWWWQEQGGQGLFTSNSSVATHYLTGTIEGNLIGTNASAGLWIMWAKSMVARNNTVVSAMKSAWAAHNAFNGGSQINLCIGSDDPSYVNGSTSGTHILDHNVTEFMAGAGTPTLTSNVVLGKQGTTISYESVFDGIAGDFTPNSLAEFTVMFAPKAGGLLDLTNTVGALKKGATDADWHVTIPGGTTETITPGSLPITGASITPVYVPGSSFTETGVVFDGTADYLTKTGTIAANSKTALVFISCTFAGTVGGSAEKLMSHAGDSCTISRHPALSGAIQFVWTDTVASPVINLNAGTVVGATRIAILAALDADATSSLQLWKSGAWITNEATDSTGGAANLDFATTNDTGLGARADGVQFFNGTMYRIAMWTGLTVPDVTNATVRDKFCNSTTGVLVDPATSVAAYGTPAIDFYGTAAQWNAAPPTANHGSTTGWTMHGAVA